MLRTHIKKLIHDILRDTDSEKYSTTKMIALSSFGFLCVVIIISIYIMLKNNEIDYFLIGELMFFILTLLGFKTFTRADYKKNSNVVKNE